MDEKYEINIQARLSETLMTCLSDPTWMSDRNVSPVPRYSPSIATPNSVQGTDTEKLGNKPYDLAQKFHDRPPRVFEIKVTDPVPGGRQLVRPNIDQARTLCQIAKLGCRIHLCVNVADDYSIGHPSDIIQRANQFAVCSVEDYLEICKQDRPILYFPKGHPEHTEYPKPREIHFQTLEKFLTKWLAEKPPRDFNMRTSMIPFSGKVITAHNQLCQAMGEDNPNAIGITRGTEKIGMVLREEFPVLHQIIENATRGIEANDEKLEKRVVAALERATNRHLGIEPENASQAIQDLKKAADNRKR